MNASASEESRATRRTWIDHTSELATSADAVAALLRDLDNWPTWTPGLVSIRRSKKQPPAPGGSFTMVLKPKGAPTTFIPCKITRFEPRLVEWGGGIGKSIVRHSFEIEELGPSRCRVRQLEYATGVLALLARPIEKLVYKHDLAWSRALEQRFGS